MDPIAITSWFSIFNWSPLDPSWEQRRKATWAWRKFKKARRWARVLRFVPFVRMIAIGNALGYGNCSPESDIDLVIITAPRRIWTVRLLVVTFLRLLRQRPGEHTRDAICPSFFLTTEALNLQALQIDRGTEQLSNNEREARMNVAQFFSSSVLRSWLPPDPYLLFWLTQLTVLYDKAGTYDAFWHANGQWVRRWLPDARPRAIHSRLVVFYRGHCEERSDEAISVMDEIATGRLPSALAMTKWRSRFVDALERWSRRFQERRFSPEIRALANQDSRVIVNDRMLKFHTNDRRAQFRGRWLYALSSRAAEQQS